jgi:hypothetical protein
VQRGVPHESRSKLGQPVGDTTVATLYQFSRLPYMVSFPSNIPIIGAPRAAALMTAPDRTFAPLEWYSLLGPLSPMVEGTGDAFSTAPKVGVCARTARKLVCKDDPLVVEAECIGYALANLVRLEVPRWGVARVKTGEVIFVTEYQDERDVLPFLRGGSVVNPDLLDRLLVFDVWIGNVDRKAENLVGRLDTQHAQARLVMESIDLEKSRVLRGAGTIAMSSLSVSNFLPAPPLRQFVRCEQATISAAVSLITQLGADDIRGALGRLHKEGSLFADIPSQVDRDMLVSTLVSRAQQLPRLVQEAVDAVRAR